MLSIDTDIKEKATVDGIHTKSKAYAKSWFLWLIVGLAFLFCSFLYSKGGFSALIQYMEGETLSATLVQVKSGEDNDESRTVIINLRNLSRKNLNIISIRPNCSCLAPANSGLSLSPYGYAHLNLTLSGKLPPSIGFVFVTDDSKAIKCSLTVPVDLST